MESLMKFLFEFFSFPAAEQPKQQSSPISTDMFSTDLVNVFFSTLHQTIKNMCQSTCLFKDIFWIDDYHTFFNHIHI